MALSIRNRQKTDLVAGIITISVAVLLLVATVILMTRCSAQLPQQKPTTTPTTQSIPTEPLQPPLPPNPYTPGDFTYKNGYLTCISGESMLGVDVSEYQGTIDWGKVAQAGVEFAMVRLGFRGWGEQGPILADATGVQNLQGAADAGLQVGAYFFSQAITVEEAKEEARFVLDMLDGRPLDMPIVFDWEFAPDADARTANMTAEKLNACAMAFCQEIRAAGYEPMVYFNSDIARRMLDLELMYSQGYGFWLAMYTTTETYAHRVDMWQYTSGGTVDGIEGNVDLNLYLTYE